MEHLSRPMRQRVDAQEISMCYESLGRMDLTWLKGINTSIKPSISGRQMSVDVSAEFIRASYLSLTSLLGASHFFWHS